MGTLLQTHLVRRTIVFLLAAISGYQFWLVVDRWIAAIKYRLHFGADSGSWVSMGLDTVIFGFASLLLVCVLSLLVRWRALATNDFLSQRISMVAFGFAATAICALLILVLLPTTVFR